MEFVKTAVTSRNIDRLLFHLAQMGHFYELSAAVKENKRVNSNFKGHEGTATRIISCKEGASVKSFIAISLERKCC